jgi:hypothetical protein
VPHPVERVGGGGYQEILLAVTEEAAFKTCLPLDGGFVFSDHYPLEL